MNNVTEVFRGIGLLQVEEHLAEILRRALLEVESPGRQTRGPSFARLPSYLPVHSHRQHVEGILVIDIGGTATKIGARVISADTRAVTWYVLFEEANHRFNNPKLSGDSLFRFALELATRTLSALHELAIPQVNSWQLAIIWSYATENYVNQEGIRGLVVERERYTKLEWFIEDVKNGDDVGKMFVDAFRQAGIPVSKHLVANDTPLTLKAVHNADAGLVVSTGLNATLLRDDPTHGRIVCNAEMGTAGIFFQEFLAHGDLIHPGKAPHAVEQIISGRFLGQVLAGNIMALARVSGGEVLKNLAETLTSLGPDAYTHYRTEDMTLLIYDNEKFVQERTTHKYVYSADILDYLARLAEALFARAARLSAVLAIASIAPQLEEKSRFVIALDSSLSRQVPLFWEIFKKSLQEIAPKGKTIELDLVPQLAVQGGRVTVPMLGAAHSLDALSVAPAIAATG